MLSAEREFLSASVAVWEEIERLEVAQGGYGGLDASTELRRRERYAWERYRDTRAAGAVPVWQAVEGILADSLARVVRVERDLAEGDVELARFMLDDVERDLSAALRALQARPVGADAP